MKVYIEDLTLTVKQNVRDWIDVATSLWLHAILVLIY